MKSAKAVASIHPRFRILRGKDIALGPGKVELLEQVRETGYLGKAAEKLGMSYMRAWTLLKTMEHCFAEPLVTMSRGGVEHGGAKLTANGIQVIKLYRDMEKQSRRATKSQEKELLNLLRD